MRVCELREYSILLTLLLLVVGVGCDEEPAEGDLTGCEVNAECEAGDYCETPVGECGDVGECLLKPTLCPYIYQPVCGCDGNDYGNHCFAKANGVSIASEGDCP
jgi:hypothetical protein